MIYRIVKFIDNMYDLVYSFFKRPKKRKPFQTDTLTEGIEECKHKYINQKWNFDKLGKDIVPTSSYYAVFKWHYKCDKCQKEIVESFWGRY